MTSALSSPCMLRFGRAYGGEGGQKRLAVGFVGRVKESLALVREVTRFRAHLSGNEAGGFACLLVDV